MPFFLLGGKLFSSIIYLLLTAFTQGLDSVNYGFDLGSLILSAFLFFAFIFDFKPNRITVLVSFYLLLLFTGLSTSPVYILNFALVTSAGAFFDLKFRDLLIPLVFPLGRVVYEMITLSEITFSPYLPGIPALGVLFALFIKSGQENKKDHQAEIRDLAEKHGEEYSKIQEYVNIISEISASVLYLPVSELDWTINLTLETIGVYGGVNRCFIYEYDKNNRTYTTIYQWKADQTSAGNDHLEVVEAAELPWMDDSVQNGQIIMVNHIKEIPQAGEKEKEDYQKRHIKSVLIIPLFHAKGILGCIGFESDKKREFWEDQTINLLNVVGQVTVTALERKKNANAFQVNDERFSELTENISQIFFLINQDFSDVIYVSPPFEKIWNIKVEEIYSNPYIWLNRVHPDDKDLIKKTMQENIQSQRAFTVEFRLGEAKSKHVTWIFLRAFPVKDEIGQIYRYAGIAEDITEKKQVEIKLAQARSQEVDIGAKIQQSLLLGYPDKEVEGLELCSMSLPSQEIDGDFFDFYFLNDHAVDFVIGDVMGKGIPAALMGAASKSGFLRAQLSLQTGPEKLPAVSSVVSKVDSYIAPELIKINKFVTLYYCRVDMEEWQFHYVDCGHTSIIYYSADSNSCWFLKGANMPLGFMRNQNYSEFALPLFPGDIIFFYSDGISEAVNGEGELFGEERLLKLVKSNAHIPAEDLIEVVKNRAFEYSKAGFKDDVTSIALKVTKRKQTAIELELSKVFPRNKEAIRKIRGFLGEIMDLHLKNRCSEEDNQAIILGINEAVTNIVEHGGIKDDENDTIILNFALYRSMAVFIFTYKSRDFDWKKKKKSSVLDYDTNGYGLSLIEDIMDSVIYYKGEDHQFRISMIKNTAPPEQGESNGR